MEIEDGAFIYEIPGSYGSFVDDMEEYDLLEELVCRFMETPGFPSEPEELFEEVRGHRITDRLVHLL